MLTRSHAPLPPEPPEPPRLMAAEKVETLAARLAPPLPPPPPIDCAIRPGESDPAVVIETPLVPP